MIPNQHPNHLEPQLNNTQSPSLPQRDSVITGVITIVILISLAACGDLVNKPEDPAPFPPHSVPKPEETPHTPQKPEEKPSKKDEHDRMCEAERQWAYRAGLIDLNQLRLYQNRNLAPVFNTPGERQSGVDGWVICERALEINGFISRSSSLQE